MQQQESIDQNEDHASDGKLIQKPGISTPTRDEALARIMKAHEDAGRDPEQVKEMLEALSF